MDLSEQLCCGVCRRYFILASGWMSSWLWHRRPSPPRLPPSRQPSPAQLSPCLLGAGLVSQQQREYIQPARVTRRDGDGSQESIWTHARSPSLTPRDSDFTIPHVSIPPVPQIGGLVMVLQVVVRVSGGLRGFVVSPRRTIQALWNSFQCDDTGTFPFPSDQKMPQDERFKPELTIAGLKPKLPFANITAPIARTR